MLFFYKHQSIKFYLLVAGLIVMPCQSMADVTLSIQQAEQLALTNDPLIKSYHQYASAYKQQSVASNQWPDPKMKFGFQSLPTDSFDLDQEPMTQLVVGYSQMIPRGNSQNYETELMLTQSDMEDSNGDLRYRQVLMSVRRVWLNVYLQEESEKIIKKNRFLFKQQLDVSQSMYSSGKSQQQDVLQAELELSLIDDQLQQISTMKNEARAQLARWVGGKNAMHELVITDNFNNIKINQRVDKLLESISQHPEIIKQDAKITAQDKKIALAQQLYKPQWGFELNYGKRSGANNDGSDRADFVSGMVVLDIPVFTENKQDRIVLSNKKNLLASKYEKQDKVLSFKSNIHQLYARLEKLKTRLYLYDDKVLPQARQNSKAALNGYQSGVISFFTMTRARSAELKAELQRLKLYNEQLMAYVEMRFMVGEK